MLSYYEAPSFEELLAEQAEVQRGKFQGRTLESYDLRFFPGETYNPPSGCAIKDLVRPLCGDFKVSLRGLIRGMYETKQRPIRWADMGGGRALAMREVAADAVLRPKVEMTNIDLFDYGLDGLDEEELEYLEDLAPKMTHDTAKPTHVRADVTDVKLAQKPDIITSVDAVQYLHNPLGAMTNWYNQLADGGVALVATGSSWPSWIRYDRTVTVTNYDEVPMKHIFEELRGAHIRFEAVKELDWEGGLRPLVDPNDFSRLALQKTAHTELAVTAPVSKIMTHEKHYKTVFYREPVEGQPPIVQAIKTA